MAAELITIAEARERVLAAVRRLEPERIAIAEALDRVLAAELEAAGDVPPFDSSAMDGYAVAPGPAGRTLAVVGESRAGAPSDHPLADGEAIRISTGAAVPPGVVAVIPQEQVEARDGAVVIGTAVTQGDHVRPAGEVMRAGAVVLAPGTRLGPGELAAAIAAGAGELTVARRPVVRVLCTGDELREPGSPLAPGQIHNSNGPMLVALAKHSGALTSPAELLADDRVATEAGLASALAGADVVIVSGGVSVGPHDHVKPALASLGVEERFWGVALQPGKPTWFGTREHVLVFGLPGNPVSAAVTFSLFAAPALAALQGAAVPMTTTGDAVLGTSVRRNTRREQAIRVRLERRDGSTIAIPNGAQDSHALTSLLGADALALIPRGDGELQAGTTVALAPLPG
ncbi:MAG TPA: gephyrin-like molybdotransferase Glp [Solirubrobacteraceae bacterium]|nr:gephyrin-like molybdotransferase Glp [Solirubrobacteraceae bacterium]